VERQVNQSDKNPHFLLSHLHSQQQVITDQQQKLHAQRIEIQTQSERIEELEQQLDWLKRQVFGRKSERVVLPGQAELFATEQPEAALPEDETEHISYQRRKPKRMPLPQDLPRERIELDVAAGDKVCPCCEVARRRIDEEITEELAFQPAKFWVREYVRFKYACPTCEEGGVVTAPMLPRPIPKGIFGPEVLAQLLVSKYEDHIPLHRQLKVFRRHGIELSESTVNDAVLQSARLLGPLAEGLKSHILGGNRVFTDDTPVTLKSNVADESRQSRLWVYIRQGEEEAAAATVFDFTTDRSRNGPLGFLNGFEGYLQADAYPGYDVLYASRLIVEVGCWSHCRRYFEKAARLHKKAGRAHVALRTIRKLFMIEREIKDLSSEQRFWARRQRALPVLREFKDWLDKQHIEVSTKSKFGEAVTYTLNQWDALLEYVNHGMLEISNNSAENAIRPVAVGRKNWMFFGSDRGGKAAAVIFSLMATCKQNGVNPWAWLAYVLEKLPVTDPADYPALLPFHFNTRFPL
jgi:transposase